MLARYILILKKVLGSKLPARQELLLRMPQGSVCAEIGVYKGDFSEMILEITKPKKLHLIDPWKYQSEATYRQALYGGISRGQAEMDAIYDYVCRRFSKALNDGTIVIHRMPSEAAVDCFPDSYFDWIYIDGNHLYEYVKKDLELYFPKIKAGGFITGDDYGVKGWWNNGVQQAVDEFVKYRRLKLEVLGSQFIIYKPEATERGGLGDSENIKSQPIAGVSLHRKSVWRH
ncbi:class I SAM-dependent methyltransferase [Rhodothermus profundi]|uniref:Methyltransferase domain-containing protein n=1 Tax=Rhodothermus profundi TaxID=633813 RepID=A0A1M6SDR9_9BACT|nr:class I SAM-dependent methyltransferase [Rhodothermus profundi]SHK42638.1 Methyltransferase domain-containing protein [Rhodothermus profundi]